MTLLRLQEGIIWSPVLILVPPVGRRSLGETDAGCASDARPWTVHVPMFVRRAIFLKRALVATGAVGWPYRFVSRGNSLGTGRTSP